MDSSQPQPRSKKRKRYLEPGSHYARNPTPRSPPSSPSGVLQGVIDAVDAFLNGIGLALAAYKTEALLVHPRASTRRSTPRLSLWGLPIEWSTKVRYLGDDHGPLAQLAAGRQQSADEQPQGTRRRTQSPRTRSRLRPCPCPASLQRSRIGRCDLHGSSSFVKCLLASCLGHGASQCRSGVRIRTSPLLPVREGRSGQAWEFPRAH
ncbi:hypothetical protein MRX96_001859 [Rhipicephalus microplus]